MVSEKANPSNKHVRTGRIWLGAMIAILFVLLVVRKVAPSQSTTAMPWSWVGASTLGLPAVNDLLGITGRDRWRFYFGWIIVGHFVCWLTR